MRVVYEKPIKQKIDDEILKAKELGKVIDKFILSETEWDAFIWDVKDRYLFYASLGVRWSADLGIDYIPHVLYKGVLVFKEEDKDDSNAK